LEREAERRLPGTTDEPCPRDPSVRDPNMSALPEIRFVIKDYDFLAPLACGDVKPEGFGLILERDTPGALDRTLNDKTIDAGKLSLSRYVRNCA